MTKLIRVIPVRDTHGDELKLYEYEPSAPYLTLMGLKRGGGSRLALDTGEPVRRLDDDNYAIIATGETLTRIQKM